MRVLGRHILISGGSIALVIALALLRPGPLWHRSLPDFQRIDDIGERKEAFFEFLLPYVEEANAGIASQRRHLQRLSGRVGNAPLDRRSRYWLEQLAEEHQVELGSGPEELQVAILELLLRVDRIPASLALAQAALESGWGTSRFAQKGNNLYGIWCYDPGCGIVPLHRPTGASYEVARYRSPAECFSAYINALNANPAYRPLWTLRQQARLNGDRPAGYQLAGGLRRYSQEGDRYISKVRSVIQGNDLAELD